MIARLLLALLVAVVVVAGTVKVWHSLQDYNTRQITRLAETESYATRSQLVRDVEGVITALQGAQAFWSTYGQLPRQQWSSDADIEMARIPGVRTLLWDDPANQVRFARTAENPVFDFRPDENQWLGYQLLLARARQADSNTMSGPFTDSDGRPYFEIYLVNGEIAGSGRLVAIVDAQESFKHLLMDASPGYAIQVLWRDTVLYQHGQPATGIPADWVREGHIRTSLGPVWKVVHAPTADLAATFETPAIDVILLLGLIIAVLMATLTFENWRAHSRARAALRAERELAKLNKNLEQQIERRTRELANRTADLQTITDSVAHDLRNPLNSIAMNVQLFEAQNADTLSADSKTTLQRIPAAVRQMADILDRMLGLSRVAHVTFKREPLDMKRLFSEVFEDLAATEDPPPVRFDLVELPPADADRKLVRMLVMNLLSNALKYTRKKDPRHIRVDSHTQSGVTVYSVTDNGMGFDQRSAERLFEAFQRLDEARATDGIGLGLAIVARVVGRHGGRIWAEGEVGQRASFYFTLEPEPGTVAQTDL